MSFAPPKPEAAASSRLMASTASKLTLNAAPNGRPVKISKPDGLLVMKVAPEYPLEAKIVRLEGTMVLRTVIDTTGEVASVNALSCPPLLESVAVEAVKHWQYRSFSMTGQPVEVENDIRGRLRSRRVAANDPGAEPEMGSGQ